jgi:fructuronate reductase
VTARLCEATLDSLPEWVARPTARPAPRVVHLGIGAFHRAHQAPLFEALGWGVTAASLRAPAVRDAMAPQDFLYSLVVGDAVRVIGAVRDVLVARDAMIAAMAAPGIDIVTLTITEKGYLPDPARRGAADLIAAALGQRRARGLAPFTAISCDNLPENGRRLRDAVLAASAPDAAAWIARDGAFPQTMVDRIVPATEDADIDALAARTGLVDRAMVKAEPFWQWVIEDRFAGPRPDFESAGVQLAADIAPWEAAKLRLLNGAHSAIAWLGGLAGIDYVHEVVAIPAYARFLEALWDEAAATLSPPPGLDIAAYRRALMARFANPGLPHRTRQIAIDGSQKLPQRLLAPIADRLARGQGIAALALAVAGWMRWQSGRTDAGAAFAVDDPLAGETARRLAGLDDPGARARALLAIGAIFPPSLAADPRFADHVSRQLTRLAAVGARATIEEFTP